MKKSIFIGLIFSLIFVSCLDTDYPYVDGQWQLKTVTEDGIETKVDTVFYSFMLKRNVFAYVFMDTPDHSYAFYGYVDKLSDEEIILTMDEGFYNKFLFDSTDWREKQRRYDVLKMNSKNLVLSYNNRVYSFEKH